MTDFEDEWFVGSVEHNPEIARRLGQFLAEFATLEADLVWMLGIVLGGGMEKEDIAWAILGPVQSITTRCQILADAAEAANLTESAGINGFVSDIKAMNTVRNEYVHALYETNHKTFDVRLTTFALSTSRRQQKRPVTPKELDIHIAEIRAIHRKIIEAYFIGELHPLPKPSPQIPP